MAEVAPVPTLPQGSILQPNVRIPGIEALPKPGSLYVGDLSQEVNENHLLEKFSPLGNITSIRVCRDIISGRSLGYAYVNFQSFADAERAINLLNYEPLKGKYMRIMFVNKDPTSRRNGVGNIFIKKLHPSIDSKTLHDTFARFGVIQSCKVCTDENGQSRGFGFVGFSEESAAKDAIESVNGMLLAGAAVIVSKFVPKKERVSDNGASTFTNVFVKNIPFDNESALRDLFSPYGEITSLFLARDKAGRPFGCVNFKTNESAVKAIAEIDNKSVNNMTIFCSRAQSRAERSSLLRRQHEERTRERDSKTHNLNLYIKNLDDDVDDAKLKEAFSKFGSITSAKVMRDQTSGVSRGFGFVSFENPEEVTKAITEMSSKIISSKPLYVALAQRKAERQASLAAQRRRIGIAPLGNVPFGVPNMYYPPTMGPQSQYPPRFRPPYMGMMGPYAQMGYGQFAPQQMQRPPRMARPAAPATNQNQGAVRPPQNRPVAQQMMFSQEPLNASALAAASDAQRKQVLGERLFPKIRKLHGDLAGKITGMLLEMDNSELLHLLEDDVALRDKSAEALAVLNDHDKKQNNRMA